MRSLSIFFGKTTNGSWFSHLLFMGKEETGYVTASNRCNSIDFSDILEIVSLLHLASFCTSSTESRSCKKGCNQFERQRFYDYENRNGANLIQASSNSQAEEQVTYEWVSKCQPKPANWVLCARLIGFITERYGVIVGRLVFPNYTAHCGRSALM